MRDTHKRRVPIKGLSDTEESLLQMVIALTSQLSVMRERLDTLETLLAAEGTLAQDAVEQFVPTPADAQRRDALRQGLVSKVLRPIAAGLESDLEQAEAGHD